jgi:cytochrome c oxidase cbb3-type subunit 3
MAERAPPKVLDAGHDYDGIEEFDNRLPNWWLLTLHGAIIFAIGYWAYYHTFGIGPDQLTALNQEIEIADKAAAERLAKMGGVSNEVLASVAKDAEAVARGKTIYDTNCIACHGFKGEGTVGPNLTDAYWMHGHNAVDIHKVVAEGKLDKGMPAWAPVLGPQRVREVVGFLLTLRDTNVAGKAPQGKTADGQEAPAAGAAPTGGAPAAAPGTEAAPADADPAAAAAPAAEAAPAEAAVPTATTE